MGIHQSADRVNEDGGGQKTGEGQSVEDWSAGH